MTYSSIGILLALFSAVTTASAHALLKSGKDKLAVRAMIGGVGTIAAIPVCLFVPIPSSAMLPWLATACLLHAVYQLVLIRAYEAADFSRAYPIARGIAPLATGLLGVLLLGDQLTPLGFLGIALVSAGILAIASGQSMARAGLVAAIAAGLLTTAYTIVDAHAVRLAPMALTFIAWFFLLDGLVMFPIFAFARKGRVATLLRAEGRQGVVAGIITLVGFGSALFALRLAPTGIVSALRETSVLFAMFIAVFVLREQVDRRHMASALVMVLGTTAIIGGSGWL